MIHRDIKPANVMLNQEGQVRVADFGLAKSMELGTSSGLTNSSMSMGTPDYVAPESLISGIASDHRADLYAVGVTLYNMLTGDFPRGRWKLPSEKVGSDVRFDAIINRAMETEREQRYQSAREMRRDLDVILRMPLEKPGPAQRQAAPARKPVMKGPRSDGTSAVAGGGGAPDGRSAVLRRKAGNRSILITVGAVVVLGIGAFFMFQKPQASLDPRSGGLQAPTKNLRDGGKNEASSSAARAEVASAAVANAPLLANATKDTPFVNTLGMKFVPVPITGGPTSGQRVLFSVWETRVQDYEVFANETKRAGSKPSFPQERTHPAVSVSWEDATAFCIWLTDRERKAGKLAASESCRLPSDHEWSCAVQINDRENPALLPSDKSGKLSDVFPWGRAWPPPAGAGNFSGEETVGHEINPATQKSLAGYRDEFIATAPVGSFAPDRLGLYDLSGNAREWCEDWFDATRKDRVLRGGSWNNNDRGNLLSSSRNHNQPENRNNNNGLSFAALRICK